MIYRGDHIKKLIEGYIQKLTVNDIEMFAVKNNISLTDKEKEILLNITKEKYEILLYGDPNPIFCEVKNLLSKENYEKIYLLYYDYKEKYKNYL